MSLTKKVLRKEIKDLLKTVPDVEIKQQSNSLRSLPEYMQAKCIAYYMNMDAEVNTTTMIQNAFSDNKRVFLPKIEKLTDESHRIHGKQVSQLRMLEVNSLEEVQSLQPTGKYRIREPLTGTDALDSDGLDLIIVPGVAFTKDGHRMGHGVGFYDSYIARHTLWSLSRFKTRPTLVAVGLTHQLLDQLPFEEHDHPMDVLIVGGKVYRRQAL